MLLTTLSPVLAEDNHDIPYHVIDSYEFRVDGKSKIFMLQRSVVPPGGDPPFDSIESMERTLDQKQAKLFNMRVFEAVSYEYHIISSTAQEVRYRVIFHVDDAFTFLPIPYPKYDSNYGFRLGLKLYDKNLFGLFGDLYGVVHATQIDSSWNDWKWYSEMRLKNLTIGTSNLNLVGAFKGIQQDSIFTLDNLDLVMDWQDIRLAGSTLALDGELDTTFVNGTPTQLDYRGKFSWLDIPIFGTALNLKGSYEAKRTGDTVSDLDYLAAMDWRLWKKGQVTTSFLASYDENHDLSTSIRFAGIPIGTTRMTLEPEVVQKVEESRWDVTHLKLLTTFQPLQVFKPFRLNLNFIKPLLLPQFQVTSRWTLLEQKLFDVPYTITVTTDNTFDYSTDRMVENEYGISLSSSLRLPFKTNYGFAIGTSFMHDSVEPLDNTFIHVTEQSLSFGEVNWKNNLRKGVIGALRMQAKYADIKSQSDAYQNLSYDVSADISMFFLFGKHIGLSSRFTGSYAHLPTWAWNDLDSDERHFPLYIPDGELSPNEQIRGILDTTIHGAIGKGDYRKLGAVMNLDATLMFIKFKGFAEGFMSAFMDIGVFTHSSSTDNSITWDYLAIFKTIGVEGYGILDKFRSYPIRGSLGFNLDHVIEHLKGARGFSEIEFELMIGMGLHY